jgi:hypothetical protein
MHHLTLAAVQHGHHGVRWAVGIGFLFVGALILRSWAKAKPWKKTKKRKG